MNERGLYFLTMILFLGLAHATEALNFPHSVWGSIEYSYNGSGSYPSNISSIVLTDTTNGHTMKYPTCVSNHTCGYSGSTGVYYFTFPINDFANAGDRLTVLARDINGSTNNWSGMLSNRDATRAQNIILTRPNVSCTEELVDYNTDGIFEHCGCNTDNTTRNGHVCKDTNNLTGVCVGDKCDTIPPAALNCGRDGCSPADKANPASINCSSFSSVWTSTGWACQSSFTSFNNHYFTQSGLCATNVSGGTFCADAAKYNYICSNGMQYYVDCAMCGDGADCDDTLTNGDFNATKSCAAGNCSGPRIKEKVDVNFDGSFEDVRCGGCNGCRCDKNNDNWSDGLCVNDECVTSGEVVIDCGNTCDVSDISSPAYKGCLGHDGLACSYPWTPEYYFKQTGICSVYMPGPGLTQCVYFGTGNENVCLNSSGKYYGPYGCGNCPTGSKCNIYPDGNFDPTYGACQNNICNPTVCLNETVDANRDGVFEQCGCRDACDGCVCDNNGDGTPDGLCVDYRCETTRPISAYCWDSTCNGTIYAYKGCNESVKGYACDSNFVRSGQRFFKQDGICANAGGTWTCVTTGHVCKNGTMYYSTCSRCSNGNACDPTLNNGMFNEYEGACNTGACQQYTTSDYFDWRKKDGQNWMTPVKNQGGCGSCWAFAAAGVIEAKYNIQQNNPSLNLDLSEQNYVADCCWAGSCSGGWMASAWSYTQTWGINNESCYPYQGVNSNCLNDSNTGKRCKSWAMNLWHISSYSSVSSADMKNALMAKGPLGVHLYMGGNFNTNGVYYCPAGGAINHAVVLVGWNETGRYWIIKNSWGSGWGEGGYFKLAYGNCSMSPVGYVENIVPPTPCSNDIVDSTGDGYFDTCGCNNNCSGCLCDPTRNYTARGICVGSTCDTIPPAALMCGPNNCTISNNVNASYSDCTPAAARGLACDNTFTSFPNKYFTQDGICSDIGGTGACVTTGHVCKNGTTYYNSCTRCQTNAPCDNTLTSGDFKDDGTCNGASCVFI